MSSVIVSLTNGVVTLEENSRVWMTTADNERAECTAALKHARGRVLICGLGLGYVIYPLLFRDDVEEIVVVEWSQPIIDAVWPHVKVADANGRKARVVHADVRSYVPDVAFDYVWLDIWDDADRDRSLADRYRALLPKARVDYWLPGKVC